METSNRYKLTQGIIELSDAKTWDEAKLEWDLVEIYHQKEPDIYGLGFLAGRRQKNHHLFLGEDIEFVLV